MPVAETTCWGREFLWPDEIAYENETYGWLSRMAIPDPEEAITLAAEALREFPREQIQLRPVLMREESEVEAKINGHECVMWVECTRRARSYEPMWRVEILDPSEVKTAADATRSPTDSTQKGDT